VIVGAAAVVVVASFLPWVRSGAVARDSFATVRAAQRIGVVGQPVWERVLAVWYVAPLLGAVCLAGAAVGRRAVCVGAALALAVLAAVLALVVVAAPVDHGAGPVVALLGSLVVMTAAVADALARRRAGARERQTARASGIDAGALRSDPPALDDADGPGGRPRRGGRRRAAPPPAET
jgi:NADH:ubiquinone oxidoreductase subunit K